MAKFEKIPLEQFNLLGKVTPAKMKVIEHYKEKIESLEEKDAGLLTLEEGEDAKEARSDLKTAAGLVGKALSFKISDDKVGFAIKEGKKRRRPRGKKKEKEEGASEESS